MPDDGDDDRSSNTVVRGMRSTVGRESTTFGFSILVTVTFGILQVTDGTPQVRHIFVYALGAVLSFTALEGVLSKGFRMPMPQHHTNTQALATALNLLSVGLGLGAALVVGRNLDGLAAWGVAPLVAGTVYLVAESLEVALAERILSRESKGPDAEEVTS